MAEKGTTGRFPSTMTTILGKAFVTAILSLLLFNGQLQRTDALRLRFPLTSRKADSVAHANTCQCECCYNFGMQQHTECISSVYTMFDVARCVDCSVASCASHFPISCGETTSIVNTVCIVRKGWLLRLVPFSFILVSIGLLIYGIFFKKFDGYHPVSHSEPVRPRSIHQMDYMSTAATPQARTTTPALPPIAENQELVDPIQTPR